MNEEPNQYLTFQLAGELYAIGILRIKEILEYEAPTRLPMLPACLRGVINLRGAAVPVMDPLIRFSKESSPITKRTCIVIMEVHSTSERQVVGVIVDAVNEVREIAPIDIEPPPQFGSSIRNDFIQGLGKIKGNFVPVLNVDHAFSIDRFEASAAPTLSGMMPIDLGRPDDSSHPAHK